MPEHQRPNSALRHDADWRTDCTSLAAAPWVRRRAYQSAAFRKEFPPTLGAGNWYGASAGTEVEQCLLRAARERLDVAIVRARVVIGYEPRDRKSVV